MIVDYYILKDDINQEILERYGYSRPNENYNYCKSIKKDDRFVIITVNKAGRFEMRGYFYNINMEECIQDLINANLVEAVELSYDDRPIIDEDEYEDNLVIGLGPEMLGEDY